MSKQSLLKALQSVENMHTYMAGELTQTIITDIRASIENNTTLRDQFAMAALQGMLAHPDGPLRVPNNELASFAYSMADKMLRARKQGGE